MLSKTATPARPGRARNVLRDEAQGHARAVHLDRQPVGVPPGDSFGVEAQLRVRHRAVAVRVDLLRLLKRRDLRHVHDVAHADALRADFDAGEVVDGEVAERVRDGDRSSARRPRDQREDREQGFGGRRAERECGMFVQVVLQSADPRRARPARSPLRTSAVMLNPRPPRRTRPAG
ncbi:MAG: hypothetical protein LC800_03710 [Acidobacteria bacterium]|nr:hypothetical protein [Acidobacteriota bacterium]